tara:strand:+ start:4513 stop:5433 length:921 start_codon:yes stop_codon:yes gene_type:complete
MVHFKKLIGHDYLFHYLINLYENNNLPNKILLNGNKGIGKYLFSSHLLNYILSEDEDYKYNLSDLEINQKNKSYLLYLNNTHPNVFLISKSTDKKNIEVSQIREMIKFQNNSSFNNKPKFVIIDNVSDLNQSSTNALLKTIEEPNKNVFFMLTYNTGSFIKETLKSRCIEFKLFLNSENIKFIIKNYFSEDIYDSISQDILNYYNNPSFLISLIEYLNENSLDYENIKIEQLFISIIQNKHYSKNKFVYENINSFIELFFYKKANYKNIFTFKIKKYFIYKLNQIKKYNLDMESYFIEFKQRLLSE